MDHVSIPLDRDHIVARSLIVDAVVAAAGLVAPAEVARPHVTVVGYTDLGPAAARLALEPVVAATAPFVLHSHGFGFFTGDGPNSLNLHVPVVRAPALDALHQAACVALEEAGAELAGWTTPQWWTPHITLLDRGLDPSSFASSAAWLAGRRHPSWRIPVDRLLLTGGWPDRGDPGEELLLGSA